MKGQFSGILEGIDWIGILIMLLPLILFIVIGMLLLLTINVLKLPVIFIISLIGMSIAYDIISRIMKDLKIKKWREVSIAVSLVFSVILALALYKSWIYLIVAVGFLIPLYGLYKELVKSPIESIKDDFIKNKMYKTGFSGLIGG